MPTLKFIKREFFVLKGNISSNVYEYLKDKVSDLGYDLYEVEYVKKMNGMNLTLFIDKVDGPITIADCEKVHESADVWLDELNPTNDAPYYLNVSSIGLDRPIKSDKDFARNIGKVVEVKSFTPVDGHKEWTSKIVSFTDKEVVFEDVTLDRKNIALCKLHIDF